MINEALRAGTHPVTTATSYVLPTRRLGIRPGVDVDRGLTLAGDLEDDEVARKLELRK